MRLISKIVKGMLKIILLLLLIMFFIIVYRYYFYPKFILTYSINEEIGQVIRQNNLTSLQNFNKNSKRYVCVVRPNQFPKDYLFLKDILKEDNDYIDASLFYLSNSDRPVISLIYFNGKDDHSPDIIFIYQYEKRFNNKIKINNPSEVSDLKVENNSFQYIDQCGLANKMYLYDIKNPNRNASPEYFFTTIYKDR